MTHQQASGEGFSVAEAAETGPAMYRDDAGRGHDVSRASAASTLSRFAARTVLFSNRVVVRTQGDAVLRGEDPGRRQSPRGVVHQPRPLSSPKQEHHHWAFPPNGRGAISIALTGLPFASASPSQSSCPGRPPFLDLARSGIGDPRRFPPAPVGLAAQYTRSLGGMLATSFVSGCICTGR